MHKEDMFLQHILSGEDSCFILTFNFEISQVPISQNESVSIRLCYMFAIVVYTVI